MKMRGRTGRPLSKVSDVVWRYRRVTEQMELVCLRPQLPYRINQYVHALVPGEGADVPDAKRTRTANPRQPRYREKAIVRNLELLRRDAKALKFKRHGTRRR